MGHTIAEVSYNKCKHYSGRYQYISLYHITSIYAILIHDKVTNNCKTINEHFLKNVQLKVFQIHIY